LSAKWQRRSTTIFAAVLGKPRETPQQGVLGIAAQKMNQNQLKRRRHNERFPK
jgi:hypothetical protein